MITAQMATIPERMEILPRVIGSLLPQVDRLNVMLNGHSNDQAAIFFNRYFFDNRINFFRRNNKMTDAEKYYKVEDVGYGYVFTCDDDLWYHPDYVKYMISKIEQYERKAVVTLHGRVWNELPITSFYRDRAEINPWDGTEIPNRMYRCLEPVEGDHRIHCGGDGVMAWHTDTLLMRYDYCELPDMSQLWMALVCNQRDIPQIAVEHPAGFVVDLLTEDMFETSIWNRNKHDKVQTQLVNKRWIKRD